MGVPAFFRWLSEKYPKCIQDVLEERVPLDASGSHEAAMFDWRGPAPNNRLPHYADTECDNLYIDMNGIIHPCAHPEQGPQPATEQQMYVAVCAAVDRLVRTIRPRKMLFMAIDGVAPRAKMNQQRARRFRAAQEARELAALEAAVRVEIESTVNQDNDNAPPPPPPSKKAWDSNVITPGTPFMLGLADYLRFYIRQRLSVDPSWQHLQVLFSDASIPGEGEHKIMQHVRLQRARPGYHPNVVHVLHGLDADLIMLALATHEAHFYISREEVLFGRKSIEMAEQRQLEGGFTEQQKILNQAVGDRAMQLPCNKQKPLQRVSIPILREYLQAEFDGTLRQITSFAPSLERVIDDFVFLCFFVGNDFLPHLPSLDIRDGALDFLINVYQRLLPRQLGGYLTQPGGNLNLLAIQIILAEVGAIEDYVFGLKHENEQRRQAEKQRHKARNNNNNNKIPPVAVEQAQYKVKGRAGRILAGNGTSGSSNTDEAKPLQGSVKRKGVKPMLEMDNQKAAMALKQSLLGGGGGDEKMSDASGKDDEGEQVTQSTNESASKDDKSQAETSKDNNGDKASKTSGIKRKANGGSENGVGEVGDMDEEFDVDDEEEDDDDDEDAPPEPEIPAVVVHDPEAIKAFKKKVQDMQSKQLDEYAKNVVDNVRLHEPGWKDRYYSDKCKADDVQQHGGKEKLFRTYVMGLVWVMKYYYDGCPSWKFYFPFHYAPFASDLTNIERFAKDIKSFQLGKPFNPVEQLMAVLPSDSAHAIPKAARWLMTDPESPVIDFYPKDVPVDPNGKAMPWLWVVLLPFIEEDRLLSALSSTIPKWSKDELLCNVRGLDDAYLYVHSSHPLCGKLSSVLKSGRTAKDPKIQLNDAAAYGCGGFSGSLRPPLSNELYPIDETDTKIPPPPGVDLIDDPLPDNLFLEEIDPNLAWCVSFSEPLKLPHKSILLPGAKPPLPVLTEDDKRIRRPKINRGASIANMGVSNGKSYQSGYGSMNISSYERELAQRTGRGAQMNQAGTRTWGSMEPSFKRPRNVNANPLQPRRQQQMETQGWRPSGPPGNGYPPYQQQQQGFHPASSPSQPYSHRPPYQQQAYRHPQAPVHQQQHSSWQQRPPHQQYGNPQRPGQGPPYQQPSSRSGPPQQYPNRGGPRPPQQQGYSFRPAHPPPAAPQRSRTDADTIRRLREQLSGNLRQNQR